MASFIRSRELKHEERAGLDKLFFHPSIGALPGALGRYVLLFLLTLMAGGAWVGILTAIERNWFSGWDPGPWKWVLLVPLVVLFWGPILIVPAYFAVRAYRRNFRRKNAIRRDLRDGHVEVVQIDGARSIAVVDEQQRTYFLFDLDGERILLVDAEAVPPDPHRFDALQDEDGEDLESDRPMLRPDFPSSRFALHRLPQTGRVVQLEVTGPPMQPLRVLLSNEVALPIIRDMGSQDGYGSQILRHRFDDL